MNEIKTLLNEKLSMLNNVSNDYRDKAARIKNLKGEKGSEGFLKAQFPNYKSPDFMSHAYLPVGMTIKWYHHAMGHFYNLYARHIRYNTYPADGEKEKNFGRSPRTERQENYYKHWRNARHLLRELEEFKHPQDLS